MSQEDLPIANFPIPLLHTLGTCIGGRYFPSQIPSGQASLLANKRHEHIE